MAKNEIDLKLTATDDASQVIDKVADKLDELQGEAANVEITTEADTRGIDRLKQLLEGLSGKQQEILLTATSERAQAEIKRLDRDLKRLLGDPNATRLEITAAVEGLANARSGLEDLQRLAKEDYEVELRVDSRGGGGIRQAQQDLDDLGKSADSSKSALANMVGNSAQDLGQLGGVAGSAGVALGQVAEYAADAALAGEGLGVVAKNFAAIAGPLLAITAGVAAAQAAWSSYRAEQERVAQETARATGAIRDQLNEVSGVVDQINSLSSGDPLLAAIFGDMDEDKIGRTVTALSDLGIQIDKYPQTLSRVRSDFRGWAEEQLKAAGATDDVAKSVAKAIDVTDDWQGALEYASSTGGAKFISDNRKLVESIDGVQDAVDDIDFDKVANETRGLLLATEEGAKAYQDARLELGAMADEFDVTARAIELLAEAQEKAGRASDAASTKLAGERLEITRAKDAILALRDARLAEIRSRGSGTGDANLQLLESTVRLGEAIKQNEEALSSAAQGSAEYEQAQLNIVRAAQDTADAFLAQQKAMAEARGETVTASQETEALNRSLVGTARQLKGESRQALIEWIAQLNGIPPEVVSEILATTDDLSVEDASRKLDEASATRTAQIEVEVDTTTALANLEALRLRIQELYSLARGLNYLPGLPFNPNTGSGGAGTAGEEPGRSAATPTAAQAGQPIVQQGNTYITIPTANPSEMVRALQTWSSRNGRLPIMRGR